MTFTTAWILAGIPVILILFFWLKSREKRGFFRFPSKSLIQDLPFSWKTQFQFLPDLLRLVVVVLFIGAMAGPRLVLKETKHKAEGIDLVLAVDISSSMLAEDFKIDGQRKNRLEIVKAVVKDFIEMRQSDRIGLVAFAALAYTVVPLTTDYSWLEQNLGRTEIGLIKDGTAVGSAIIASIERLRTSEAKSKVVILLTDGVSNAGEIDPINAARAAQALGIRIYTIGAGATGPVPYPVMDMFGRKAYQSVQIDIDEKSMKEIAKVTGGQYFRATDTESLRNIYKEIDKLEKTEIEEYGFMEYEELYDNLLMAALICLLLEIILTRTVLLRIP